MAPKPCITIIGTGLIGSSIGMAIRKTRGDEIDVLGYDRDPAQAEAALNKGALMEIEGDLVSAASRGDMLILALPITAIRETLQTIAHSLKSGCVIHDTASIKVAVLAWADELLPREVSYIGGDPILFGDEVGIEAAHADLFNGKQYCITPSKRASSEGVRLITDLVAMMGAIPHYIDPYEHDGLIGGVEHLADMVAMAFLHALRSAADEDEMRRMAGATFDRVTTLSMPKASAVEYRGRALYNHDNVLRWIDGMQAKLSQFRALVERSDGVTIEDYYRIEMENRLLWLRDRASQNWGDMPEKTDIPTSGEFLSEMLFGGLARRRREE
ncbi:MAG: prephenate dehydrogenase [Anaerolineae bacterium]|nr:prephenate dehydrogenase [Anaerolineae bacterium]